MRPIPTTLPATLPAALPITLHIYWDDDVTIELRYFPSRKKAMQYVKTNGITNYEID